MQNTVLNEVLEISYPDSFRIMTAEEISQLNYYKKAPNWCIKDEENHILINISWKKAGVLSSLILNEKDMIKSMDKCLSRQMQSYGYKSRGYKTEVISGKKAQAYSYTYEVGGTGMTGESISVKKGRMFYFIYTYARTENEETNAKIISDILASLSFKEG